MKVSRRFVAGLELEDALRVGGELNRSGMSVTLDHLGENVRSEAEARRSAAVYHELLDAIRDRGLDSNVSIKLTQMGIDLDPVIARRIVNDLVEHAAAANCFVRVDMEGSAYTQATIDLVRAVHGGQNHDGRVGVVVQAYLYRSAADVAALVSEGVGIRLCKGAYKEPPDLAYPKKQDVDENYVHLMRMLLQSGIHHGIATHDESIIRKTKQFARQAGIDPRSFEFQMLFGIRRDLQQSLVRDGYRMRVYVPFGREWYPYFMRRMAERPANALFIARNLLKR